MKKKMLVKLVAFIAICACTIATAQITGFAAPTESTSPYLGLTAEQFGAYKMHVLRNMFDAKFFAEQYPEVASACGNDAKKMFDYFVTEGLENGLQPNANFDVAAYAVAYPDVANANGADVFSYYLHFYKFGSNEKRNLTTKAACAEAGISVKAIESQQKNLAIGEKIDVVEIKNSSVEKKAPVVSNAKKKSSGSNNKTSNSKPSDYPVVTTTYVPVVTTTCIPPDPNDYSVVTTTYVPQETTEEGEAITADMTPPPSTVPQ